jgi:hypothetical protein
MRRQTPSSARSKAIFGVLALALALLAMQPGRASASPRPDSQAPAGADPDWLPDEDWVKERWLPFDEEALLRALRIDENGLLKGLAYESTLGDLVRRRGVRPGSLVTRLLRERGGRVSTRQLAVLRARAMRLMTQDHLADHMFFHHTHNGPVNEALARVVGADWNEVNKLRAEGWSFLDIGTSNGLSQRQMTRSIISVIRASAARGVWAKAHSRRQAAYSVAQQSASAASYLGPHTGHAPAAPITVTDPAHHGLARALCGLPQPEPLGRSLALPFN